MIGTPQLSAWDIAIAALVLVVSLILARIVHRAVTRLVGRLDGVSEGVRAGTAKTAAWAVVLLGLGVALSALGADVQPLQTAAIILAVVVFLALRGVAGQLVAGILLRTSRPYRVGDHIETGEHIGVVKQVTPFTTVVETYDGRLVHVPNLQVASNPIVNRTILGGIRVDVEVRARWDGDPDELYESIREAAETAPDVLPYPKALPWMRSAEPGRFVVDVKAFHDPELDSDAVAGGLATHLHRSLVAQDIPATVVTPPPPPPFTPPPEL